MLDQVQSDILKVSIIVSESFPGFISSAMGQDHPSIASIMGVPGHAYGIAFSSGNLIEFLLNPTAIGP